MLCLKWQEKKDVLMLSTIHEHDEAIFVETGKVTDCVFRREGRLLCLKWREKKDVLMLSTIHEHDEHDFLLKQER